MAAMDRLYQKSKSKVFERRIEFREMVDQAAQSSSPSKKKKISYNSENGPSWSSGGDADVANMFSTSDYLQWSQVWSVGPGFDNRGNTCFLNSVLQCIVYTPPVANYFLKTNHHSHCHINGFCAACALSDLIRKCLPANRGNSHNNMMHRSITPSIFVSRLHAIAKTMRLGRQEDSHEFLRFLIDAVSRGFNKNSSTSGKLNPVTAIFEFHLQSTVTCLSCKKQSHAKDPAMDLMLDIKGCNSIDKALALFSRKDMLNGRNRYKCEHCKKLCDASKQMFIASPPNILCMQLKRFEFTASGQRKISNYVSYPEALDLPYHTGHKVHHKQYDLYGVLVHSGNTSRSGHYYSFVKAPNDIWYCMDDSSVSQIKKTKILQQNAYILFYVARPEAEKQRPSASATPKHLQNNSSIPPSPPTSPSLRDKNAINVHKIHSQTLSAKIQQAQSKLSLEMAADGKDIPAHAAYPTPPISQKEVTKGPTTISVDDIFGSLNKKKPKKTTEPPTNPKPKESIKNEMAQDVILKKLGVAMESITENKKRKHDDETDEAEKHEQPVPRQLTRLPDHKIINHSGHPGIDLEHIVHSQDIVAKVPKLKSKRPKNYDIEYDEGKRKKRRTKKAWSVFDLPEEKTANNPFTHAQNRMNNRKN